MISFIFLSVFVFVSGAEQGAPGDVAQRVLTNAGYMIRYGDSLYRYPMPIRIVPPAERNPTETNEIENEDEDKRRPLFYFTSYESEEGPPKEALPTSRPYIEIRRKRDVDSESGKVGKLRRKRTYCGKCGGGHGGYGGYYVPVSYAVYPVYYGGLGGYGGGGGGKGCHTCGGGGGGGGGGSYSYSQSSASSSSGSFGWGKK